MSCQIGDSTVTAGDNPERVDDISAVDEEAEALTGYSRHWGELPLADIAESAWRVTSADRHRMHPCGPCPTHQAPYGHADPHAQFVSQACRACGCLDLLHEMLCLTVGKIEVHRQRHPGSPIVDLGAYAERVLHTEHVELQRTMRVSRGFPARPSRNDGVAGRVAATLRRAGGRDGEWMETLFRIMRSYPFSPGHVCGRWPVEGLGVERSAYFPEETICEETIRHEIAQVLATARAVAGPQWVYDNLLMPLRCNGSTCRLPEDQLCDDETDVEALLSRWLRLSYLRHREDGLSRSDALRLASREVTGLEPPAPGPMLDLLLRELEYCAREPNVAEQAAVVAVPLTLIESAPDQVEPLSA